MFRINEMFISLEGEGLYTGTPTYFIRTQGCSVRCTFCDSKNTWKIDENSGTLGTSSLVENITNVLRLHSNVKRVSFTGGDPLIYKEQYKKIFKELNERFSDVIFNFELPGWYSENEVSGVTDIDFEFYQEYCTHHHFAIDIKCPSSRPEGEGVMKCFDNFKHTSKIIEYMIHRTYASAIRSIFSLKAVIKTKDDLEFISQISTGTNFQLIKNYVPLFVSPCFDKNNKIDTEVDVPLELCNNPVFKDWRLSLQTHKFLGVR